MKLKDAIELIDGCKVVITDEDGIDVKLNGNENLKVVSIQIVNSECILVIVDKFSAWN